MNKLNTKAYCVKHLRDSGYNIDRLDSIEYTEDDTRRWSILLDNGIGSVFLTCMKDSTVHFYDGCRFFEEDCIEIDNIKHLITYLNDRGLVNKHFSYDTKEKYISFDK